ncbi:hypothetical protein pb186bvf_018665 [Paramecium bursaria]
MSANQNYNETSLHYPALYQTQYPQQQQPIYASAEYAHVDPEQSIIIRPNDGYNTGSNKRFGLYITFMSLEQQVIIFLFLRIVDNIDYNYFYKMSTISILGNIIILIISVGLLKSRSNGIHYTLFMAYIILSCFSQFGLINLFGSHFYRYFIKKFDICQLVLMAVAFFYLLIIKNKPNAVVLFIIISIFMALQTYIMQDDHFSEFEDYIITTVISFLQSCMLKFALQDVYNGKNQIIRKNRILLGFLQFKINKIFNYFIQYQTQKQIFFSIYYLLQDIIVILLHSIKNIHSFF